MIKYFDGSVFDTECDAIVNTVNCDGYMGKGLALEFKIRYPQMFKEFQKLCKSGQIKPGILYLHKDKRNIISFPTKDSWKKPSQYKYITDGLRCFVKNYKDWSLSSVAFPKLGCGIGGLDWKIVSQEMINQLNLNIEIVICLDERNYVSQNEKKILDILNGHDTAKIRQIFKLTAKQNESLILYKDLHGSIIKLRDLISVKNIGIKTYQKILLASINRAEQYDLFTDQ